ncbi:MAG: hypothetical protein IKU03_04680 [Bacteroidales bacterium]|nr:hypothetical protein [Bacteroidales bacterium]
MWSTVIYIVVVLLLAIGIPVRRMAKRLTVVIFAIVLLGGCGMMYGYKTIKQFDKNEYEAVVASVMDDNFKMNSIISDSVQFASYRMILSDSQWQQSTSGQPIQILYFKGDKLVSYHINCTAKGGVSGLNWNTDHRFETYPPASAIPINPSMASLVEVKNIYHITDNNEYLIVVFWSNMLSKISKSAIETVKSNLSKYGNVDQASIVLINTDKYYVSLQE